jgi:gas vesicle structural protein
MNDSAARVREVTLLDLLDRVIDNGVILAGDVTISVADVDLIYLGLRVLLAPVERLPELRARPVDDNQPVEVACG